MAAVRPNILIIIADQLCRAALGCYGDPDISTPHLDALAGSGVRFDAAYSSYPVCVPFRFTWLTGQSAHSRFVPAIEWRMSPAERHFGHEFSEAGYETAYVGKWHLHGMDGYTSAKYRAEGVDLARLIGRTPIPASHRTGWDHWMGFELRNGHFDTYYFKDDDPTPRPVPGYQTDGLFGITQDYLAHEWDRSKPFCCVLSVEPPHPPYEAPPEYEARWKDRPLTLPPNFSVEQKQWGDNEAAMLANRRQYYAMVENLDDNIGAMRNFLKAQQLDDNTIVMFLADHGDMCGAHGLMQKCWPYEESAGVPLFVFDPRWPHRAGTILDDPVHTEDLMATTCGLCGITPRNATDGIDLTDLIRGDITALDRDGVMLEFVNELRPHMDFHNRPWRSWVTRRWKYSVLGNAAGSTPWQLFDLQADPYERTNLINDPAHADTAAMMHGHLRAEIIATDDHYTLSPAFGHEAVNLHTD